MKYLAIALTVALGIYGTVANADTGKSLPTLTLAMANTVPEQQIDFPTDTTPAERMEREQSRKMELLNIGLDKALEAKFSKEFEAGY
jgi:hypothetical protein